MSPEPAVSTAMGLSAKQRACLDAIASHQARTRAMPSLEELRSALGLGSKVGVLRLLRQFEERGRIVRLPHRARAIRIVEDEVCPDCGARRARNEA